MLVSGWPPSVLPSPRHGIGGLCSIWSRQPGRSSGRCWGLALAPVLWRSGVYSARSRRCRCVCGLPTPTAACGS
eukprot:6821043-Alexandrium_andersonii.AAC.1